jgi:hypothetical protein
VEIILELFENVCCHRGWDSLHDETLVEILTELFTGKQERFLLIGREKTQA